MSNKKAQSLSLNLNLSNDAFQNDNSKSEVARILRQAADRVEEHGLTENPLNDVNGNEVGAISVEWSEEQQQGDNKSAA